MVQSKATSVDQYLQELSPQQREVIAAVRSAILERLPPGYVEAMSWGMISYEVPLELHPDTYNGQPLGYLALAAQKNHYALYMLGVYRDEQQLARLKSGYGRAGKKLDMGKSCIRFRRLDDLPLDVIGELVASTPPQRLIALYETARQA